MVANRIFEKAIELFGNEEIEIVLRYLGFLISLNDDASELAFHRCSNNNYNDASQMLARFLNELL
jgi:cleavage stimulation factor subunit 3